MMVTTPKGRPLFEASGIIEAPLSTVTPLVMSVDFLGLPAEAVTSGGPARFDVVLDGRHLLYVDIDEIRRTIGLQGHWWYRGEYTVDSHLSGTRLTHRVFNVASRARWGVPLANKFFVGFEERTRASFLDGLRKIGRQLNCATHPDKD